MNYKSNEFLFGKLKLEIVEVGDVRSEVVVKINQERLEGDLTWSSSRSKV